MDIRIILQMLGCDQIETTQDRFLNDAEFYVEITTDMLSDPGFEKLGEEIKSRDAHSAFDTAHMLKGIIGNCGISPLYEVIVRIVETLRKGTPDFAGLEEDYGQMINIRNTLRAKLTGIAKG